MISLDGHGPAVLHLFARRVTGHLHLHGAGELHIATARHLVEVVETLPVVDLEQLCLDLTDLSFLDAAGLRALLTADTVVAGRDGGLRLTGLRPPGPPHARHHRTGRRPHRRASP